MNTCIIFIENNNNNKIGNFQQSSIYYVKLNTMIGVLWNGIEQNYFGDVAEFGRDYNTFCGKIW